MVGGAKSHLESNPIPTRRSERSNIPGAHQDPETPQRLTELGLGVSQGAVRSGRDGINPLGGGHH